MHAYMNLCSHMCIYARIYALMLAYVHICTHICIYARMHAYMHGFMHICTHICMYARMYAYMGKNKRLVGVTISLAQWNFQGGGRDLKTKYLQVLWAFANILHQTLTDGSRLVTGCRIVLNLLSNFHCQISVRKEKTFAGNLVANAVENLEANLVENWNHCTLSEKPKITF